MKTVKLKMYIARDKDGEVFLHKKKPHEVNGYFFCAHCAQGPMVFNIKQTFGLKDKEYKPVTVTIEERE